MSPAGMGRRNGFRGCVVTYRSASGSAVLMLGLLVAGCAGETLPPALSMPPQHLGADTGASEPAAPDSRTFRKPLSSRVLSAIAFERTTGLPAAPSRIVGNE